MKGILYEGRPQHKQLENMAKSTAGRDGSMGGSNLLFGKGEKSGSRKQSAGSRRGLGYQQSVVTESVLHSGTRLQESAQNHGYSNLRATNASRSSGRSPEGLPPRGSSEHRSSNDPDRSREASGSPDVPRLIEHSHLTYSTPASVSKIAMQGQAVAPTTMRPSLMGLSAN